MPFHINGNVCGMPYFPIYMNRKSRCVQTHEVPRVYFNPIYPRAPPAPALDIPLAPASARHARVLLSAMVKTRIFPVIFLFWSFSCYCIVVYSSYLTVGLSALWIIIIIIIMEAFIKRRIPGKTTCSKALQYNSNKVVIKLKLY